MLRKIAKDRRDNLPAVGKDLLQPPPHKERPHEITEKTKRDQVMHQVRHLDATLNFPKKMLMMPKLVGPTPLLIYKIMPLFHLCDLREPAGAQPRQGPKLVFDELAGINARTG